MLTFIQKLPSAYQQIGKSQATRGLSTFSQKNNNSILQNHDEKRMIVVGSGVAGCSAALIAAEKHNIPVTLLHAGSLPTDCNSYWAQGGIIYRNYDRAANDSAASLVADVQRAGAGLCDDGAVWKLALEGPNRVRQLLLDDSPSGRFANVPFDRQEDGSLSCCLEASHAAPRIIHYADHTGKAITDHITTAAVNHPLVTVVPDTIVTDLITTETMTDQGKQSVCLGTEILNKITGETSSLLSTRGTVLASGGIANLYEHSTNPSGFNALGSSTALATRVGVDTSDLEYVQFHPTALNLPNQSCFLLTEALRGEGAILRDGSGRAFAKDFHPDGELAPRDIVARGVYNEAQKVPETPNVFLDISHRESNWLRRRFPTIDAHLKKQRLDITKDKLPITPAAHYTCGGITTDLDGCTSMLGLYSAGEAARTGLHGGNRLASTSLLEGLVYGGAVGDYVGTPEQGGELHDLMNELLSSNSTRQELMERSRMRAASSAGKASAELKSRNNEGATDLLSKLRRIMWDHVGVVRTPMGLSHAASLISEIKEEACDLFEETPSMETAGIRDASFAGEAVAEAALNNRVSAGAHCIALESPEASHIVETERFDHVDDYPEDEVMRWVK
jgi:L-aspartate oxidase